MNKVPLTIKLNLALILLNALIWFALGLIIMLNVHPGLPDVPGMKTMLAVFSLVFTVLLLGSVFFLWKHKPAAYYLSLTFFTLTSILTIFDDVGWPDLVFLLVSIIPIALLIRDHRWYLGLEDPAQTGDGTLS